MTLALILLAVLVAALMVTRFRDALRTGAYRWGDQAIERGADPLGFWGHLLIEAVTFPLLLAVLIYTQIDKDAPHWPIELLAFAAVAALYLVKALLTGEALDPSFSRVHEPRQYWALVALLALAAAGCLAYFLWVLQHPV